MKRVFRVAIIIVSAVIVVASTALVGYAKPKPEGTVKMAVNQIGVYTDPYSATTTKNYAVFDSLYDGLTAKGFDGSVLPGLAKSWTVEKNYINYHLRQGVKFHNGEDFTSADVVFTWEHLKKETTRSMMKGTLVGTIDRVEATGPYEVKVCFSKPQVPSILPRLLFSFQFPIIPKDYTEKIGEEEFRIHPVGTGPFKFVNGNLRDYIVLKANENYWDPDKVPRVKWIKIERVKETGTRIANLLAGSMDYIDQVTPVQARSLLKNKKDLKVISWKNARAVQIFLSNKNPESPWAKSKKVRLALSYAIDREALNRALWDGLAKPAASIAQPGVIGYVPDLPFRPYDPEKAKRLLAEAGYAKGFTMPPLITYYACETVEGLTAAIASMWRDIGVKASFKILETGLLVKSIQESRNESGYLAGTCARTQTVEEYLSKFYSPEGFQSHWLEDYLTNLLSRSRSVGSAEEYEKTLKEAVLYIRDEAISLPLLDIVGLSLIGSKIKSFPHVYGQRTVLHLWSIELKKP